MHRRQIAKETGHSRITIRKVLSGLEPKYRRNKEPGCAVMDAVGPVVERWLKDDLTEPRKQRHTAHRIYTRLLEEHEFTGAESTVGRWVREQKIRLGLKITEAVVPLDPEVAQEAEVDWGSAWVGMSGERQQVKLFCMRSRYSGKAFMRAYPWERQEMFLDGHIRAFSFYGGAFPVLVYDNLTVAVRRILRGKARIEQERFTAFRSYHTFQARFCNPAQGQEKGGVEGLVGFARRNFLVPIPEVKNFDELNELLLARLIEHGERRIQGREDSRTINERHDEEHARLLPIPERPFENTKTVGVRISRYQTAQVDRNRYSVPTAYVGRRLWAHVGCEQVSFYADQKKVAEHPRVFGNSKWQIDPLHYLDLVSQRIASFESARPIRQWRSNWHGDYEVMLQTLRRRHGEARGTREFVGILQLHRSYPSDRIQEAVSEALRCQTYNLDSVKHILVRQHQSPAVAIMLEAGLMPGITDLRIDSTDVGRYNSLLAGGGQ
ncbi:MAG: IS21 family transposase [Acidobacteria bacterium]|nr:MAG: IS21 family transposase [Acidobacteriota bacterium]